MPELWVQVLGILFNVSIFYCAILNEGNQEIVEQLTDENEKSIQRVSGSVYSFSNSIRTFDGKFEPSDPHLRYHDTIRDRSKRDANFAPSEPTSPQVSGQKNMDFFSKIGNFSKNVFGKLFAGNKNQTNLKGQMNSSDPSQKKEEGSVIKWWNKTKTSVSDFFKNAFRGGSKKPTPSRGTTNPHK